MKIKQKTEGENIIASVSGEIDHHNAKEARTILDEIIEKEKPAIFYLELSEVNFCDSSGLGLVMGRMKKCAEAGSTLIVTDPSDAVMKILAIAGMEKILKIERTVK